VVDKTVALLDAIAAEPCSLADLVVATGLPRPTAHRLALALEHHEVLARDADGRFVIGGRAARWSAGADALRARAEDVVIELRDATGVSAQVYRRVGDQRLCIAAAEPAAGLRDTVPVGSLLTLGAGSAAQVLVAWLPDDERASVLEGAAFTEADLAEVRRRGWAHSLGQREPGVGSISVPVTDAHDVVIAAVSISGPLERLTRPTAAQRRTLHAAAAQLSES
jgi:DNA-binding IclR family transcriptional regulator